MEQIFGFLANIFSSQYWQNKASNGEIVDINSCNNAWYKVGFNALSSIAGYSQYTNGITCDDLPITKVNLIERRDKGRKAIALIGAIIVLSIVIFIVIKSKR